MGILGSALLRELNIPSPIRRMGKVIHAEKRFYKRRISRRIKSVSRRPRTQRGISSSKALALLSTGYVIRGKSVIPVPNRSIDVKRLARVGLPVERLPYKMKEGRKHEKVLRKAIRHQDMRGVQSQEWPWPSPRAVAEAAYRTSVCVQRKTRRSVLFAKRGIGSGRVVQRRRVRTEKSRVKCY